MRYSFTISLLLGIVGLATAQSASPVTAPASASVATPPPLTEDVDRKTELVDRLQYERSYLDAQLVAKCFTIKLSPGCWAQFAEPAIGGGPSGLGSAYQWGRLALEYSNRQHIGNLMALEASDPAVELQNRPMMDRLIDNLRSRFSLTLNVPIACTGTAYELMLKYPQEIMERLGRTMPAWSPRSGEAHITVTLSATAKDLSLTISPDGKQFTLLAPAYTDIAGSADKIVAVLEQANKNQ
jgi:hypothetical protein